MVPVADLFNHRTDKENVRIYGEDADEAEGKDVLEILVHRSAPCGVEVYNTFGCHGNSEVWLILPQLSHPLLLWDFGV